MPVADVIFTGGPVITANRLNAIEEAVAVAGNRIVAVGPIDAVDALRTSSTRVVDLKGRSLLPGFIEAHAHLGIFSIVQSAVQCGPPHVTKISDLQAAIQQRARQTPPGE